MNEFRSAYNIGDRARNRRGAFTVASFTETGMIVLYDKGGQQELKNFAIAQRIIENVEQDNPVNAPEDVLKRFAELSVTESDIDGMVDAAQSLIMHPLIDLINSRAEYDVLRNAVHESGGRYHVYVILLSKLSVYSPQGYYNRGHKNMPCVYVGQSYFSPEKRFERHKARIQSSRHVRRDGLAPLPAFDDLFSSLSRKTALQAEANLADALRELGCTVLGGR